MNSILLVVILKVFITSTVQNLIRFGDFQNIIPPQPAQVNYAYCGQYCNGIWYTTSPLQRIQFRLNLIFGDSKIITTAVNMVKNGYIQLCQDFNAVDIGKTYQYTFDSRCIQILEIKNCSIWVILNGQVVNGSNHTFTDKITHHDVGYINITQQNNTICFQTTQAPSKISEGSKLDNVTLQIYTGKIPCNVLGCKFCVLNFPDVCQVCQYLFRLEESSCKCQSKFYLNGSNCKVCLFPCETCQGQARNCLSCSSFYRLQGNQCVIADDLASASSAIASIPGIEFLSIGKIFLGNFDLFWPYYSHQRAYGQQTVEILRFIHTVQNNKWFLLSLDKKIDFNFQSFNLSDYSQYSNQQFLRMESRTSYFWDGAFEIVFFSFPTMLIVFFVLNRIFYLTFEYRISRHFRPFSFLLMIYFLGVKQDISYISFLSFSNAINLFSFKFHDKLGHIAWIFVFFLIVFFCSAAYFVAKILYNKLSKHFIDGFFPKLQSFQILSFLSIKALVIGSVNALFAKNYETLIMSVGLIEMVYLIGVIYLQCKNRCYKIQTFMFLQLLKSIIMTVFNFSLWIDWKIRALQQVQTEQQTKKLLDFNCKALVIVIVGLGALQAISTYFSGREMVNRRQKKQVPKTKKAKIQVLKIEHIKIKAQFKQEISMQQQMRAQKNYFNQNNAVQKVGKTLNSKRIKTTKSLKKNLTVFTTIHQQYVQDEQNLEIIIIRGCNDN